ncbi:MAG TPA: SemiSWEET transporter [Rhodocyclaceae bacterium]|nr:SemiSWEET transporter [Rhodocyclaceae bacterium]
MPTIYVEILGYISACLTTISFAPQAWLVWKTRSAAGVSLGMYSLFVTGIGCWLVYGYFIQSWPLFLSNLVTFVLSGFILGMKLRFG